MNDFRFSIVVCNYNYGEFVGEAIESCLNQDYPQELTEIIVVDDGSTDRSHEVIAGFAAGGRVTAIHQPNQGQGAAFAAGVARARGDFVCLLDSDDWFLPDKLKCVAERISGLSPVPNDFFLCHDLILRDQVRGVDLEATNFKETGVARYGGQARLNDVDGFYPFANPCGQIYSRALIQRLCDGIPPSDWKRGAENPIAHSALLCCGVVHYLQTPLAVYRIHGSNFFASIKDGRYQIWPHWRSRWPKLLRGLDAMLDTLDLDIRQRNERLAYLKRLERRVRTTSTALKLAEPMVSFILTDADGDTQMQATVDAVMGQSHENTEIVLVSVTPCDSGLPYVPADRVKVARVESTATPLDRCRAGYQESRGDYVVFLDGGHVPDAIFAERHLFVHRYVTLSSVTSCDIRIISRANVLLYSGPFGASGAWPQPLQYIPPHAASLRDWIFPPLPANLIRKSRLLDLLFEYPGGRDLDKFGGHAAWLLLHYAHALGGTTRINECLLSYRLQDAAAATYGHLMEPSDARGALPAPDFAAGAELIFDIFCRSHDLFSSHLPASWQAQFVAWLKNKNSPALAARLKRVAERSGTRAARALLG